MARLLVTGIGPHVVAFDDMRCFGIYQLLTVFAPETFLVKGDVVVAQTKHRTAPFLMAKNADHICLCLAVFANYHPVAHIVAIGDLDPTLIAQEALLVIDSIEGREVSLFDALVAFHALRVGVLELNLYLYETVSAVGFVIHHHIIGSKSSAWS